MRIWFKLFFLLFFSNVLVSQNLVPDSSFENNKAIPTDFSAIGNSKTWSRPGMGTTDLFCEADRKGKKYSLVGVPQNAMGYQFAHSGICYAGFFLFSHDTYREYLQTPLVNSLEKGKTYFFSMYISLADYSRTYIEQIGFCFLSKEQHFTNGDVLDDLNPVYVDINEVGRDVKEWHHVTGRYKANGTEKYLIIGSFDVKKIRRTRFVFPKDLKSPIHKDSGRDAYYFVDDVSLIEWINPPVENVKTDSLITIGVDTLNEIPANKPLILKNVLFETNKATVLGSSFSDLDKLADYLSFNPEIKLKIVGHTDNSGNKSTNKKLSEARAKQVADYLIKRGIDKKRISNSGYGDTKPLFENDTEEHKAQNRRVEIVFSVNH
jgi:OmpA-OmpF porin, OOP family